MNSDFTFSNDEAHRFMPWHIGAMVALSCLLLSLMLSLGQWVGGQHNSYENSLTVVIPGSLEKLDEVVTEVEKQLEENAAIKNVKKMKESELRGLLSPWIGSNDALSDVAVPVVLEVELRGATNPPPDVATLKASLEKTASGIEVDSNQQWADNFATFTKIMQWLAGGLAFTVLAVMAFIIMFSARASLHLHARNVGLLHSMGAHDAYIARQFQMEHFWLGLRGAVPGAVLALVVFLLLGFCVLQLNTPLLPHFKLSVPHIVLLTSMPLICALIALYSTRFSVLRELRKTL